MRISGFTFIRNAVKLDYPVVESIKSILPIVDEYIVNVVESDDGTLELIKSIDDPKIKIIESPWLEDMRGEGKLLVYYTNLALKECTGDWCFYLQGDEVVHEKYLEYIKCALEEHLDRKEVEGFTLKYKHFYGNFYLYHEGEGWVKNEVRIIRNGIGVSAYKAAHSFRINGRKLNCIILDAYIYHYGWARRKSKMKEKIVEHSKWHWKEDKDVVEKFASKKLDELYIHKDSLHFFKDTHPKVMQERIVKQEADKDNFLEVKKEYLKRKLKWKVRDLFADITEKLFGKRIGEYANYHKIGEYRPYTEDFSC